VIDPIWTLLTRGLLKRTLRDPVQEPDRQEGQRTFTGLALIVLPHNLFCQLTYPVSVSTHATFFQRPNVDWPSRMSSVLTCWSENSDSTGRWRAGPWC